MRKVQKPNGVFGATLTFGSVLVLTLAACTTVVPVSPTATSSSAPSGTTEPPSHAPSIASPSGGPSGTTPPGAPSDRATALELRTAPINLGCDSIGVAYRSVTFKIDPDEAEEVSAIGNTGVPLLTYWSQGFRAGSAEDRVVRDPAGQVVVADGDQLTIPLQDWPRLRGYFVCPTPNALYVLLTDPN